MNPTDLWFESHLSPVEISERLPLEDPTVVELGAEDWSVVGDFAGATLELERKAGEARNEFEMKIGRYDWQEEFDQTLMVEIAEALKAMGIENLHTGDQRYSQKRGIYRYNYRKYEGI